MPGAPDLARVAAALAAKPAPDAAALTAAGAVLAQGAPAHRGVAIALAAKAGAGGLQTLVAALAPDQPPAVRTMAAFAMGQMGAQAGPAVGALAALADGSDRQLAGAALFALGRIGPAALPVLGTLLGHRDEDVAVGAAQAIAQVGSDAPDALRNLKLERSTDAPPRVRIAMAEISIRGLGGSARDLQPIVGALEDAAPGNRLAAMGALQRIGMKASLAAPRVAKAAAADPDADVRAAAVVALIQLTDPPSRVVGALAAACGDPAEGVRRTALIGLAQLGPAAAAALPQVRAAEAGASMALRPIARAALDRLQVKAS